MSSHPFSKTTDAPAGVCGIYKIVHAATGRVYVGQTGRDGRSGGFARRCREHFYNALEAKCQHSKSKFGNAVRKYGADAFTFHVLQIIDASEPNEVFNEAEAKWIAALDAAGANGFNIHRNGPTPRGTKRSAETRQKMSDSRKAAIAANPEWAQRLKVRAANMSAKGRKRRDELYEDPVYRAEIIAKQSASWSPERKAAYSVKMKAYFATAEAKAIASTRMTARMADPALRNITAQPVRCVESGVTYPSVNEAGRRLGIHKQAITSVLSGRTRTAGGFHWERVMPTSESLPPVASDAAASLAA